jgi:hypothetical protein
MRRFQVRRKGSDGPVYNAYAPDRLMELTVSHGTFTAVPGDYVIEVATGRILIVPARFFDRAWEDLTAMAEKAKKAAPPVKVEAAPEHVAEHETLVVEEADEDLPELLEEEATPAVVPASDEELWAMTARTLADMAVGYQINTKSLRTKKQLIDAIRAAERG